MALFKRTEEDNKTESSADAREVAPEAVVSAATAALGGEPRFVCSSDLTLAGEYKTIWVVATAAHLAVISPGGVQPEVLRQFSLAEIEQFEIQKYVGNAVLRARIDQEDRDVVRYSLALSDKFDHARETLDEFRRTERGEVQSDDGREVNANRCDKCHQTIPSWATDCPHCKPKGKVLLRALKYLLPWWHLSLVTLILLMCVTALNLAAPVFTKILVDDIFGIPKVNLASRVDSTATFLPTDSSPKLFHKQGGTILIGDEGRERVRYASVSLTKPYGFKGCQRGPNAAAYSAGTAISRPARPLKASLNMLLWVVFGGILGTRLAATVLGALRSYLMRYLGERIIMSLQQQIYAHLHKLSLGFYDQQQTGSLMYRVNSDTGRLQGFIAGALQDILRDVSTALIICAVLLKTHFILALIVLIPVPIIVWGSREFGKRMHRIYHRVWRLGSALSAVLADAIPGVRVVKAFDKERYEVRRYAHLQHLAFRVSMRASMMSNIFYPALGLLTMVGTLSIWGYGGYLVLTGKGSLTLGALLLFLSYAGQFYAPIERLAHFNDQLQQVSTSAERVFEILDAQPDIADRENAITLKEVKGEITFQGVTFAYPDHDPVIKNLSMHIQPGEMIGVVGPTGAGKTTLINLVCRFYDINGGAILLDGVDLRDIAVHSLRSQVGVVLQEPYLFQGTVEENIAYGRTDSERLDVVRSAEAAFALDFILKTDDGFDTLVGERGIRLSGGQKQRLSIARAILRNPRILILDEATSAVDTETEDKIRRAIEVLVQNRTTIAIAHRLSTLRQANRLAVLDKGELVEMGTHEELLAQDGLFKRLWTKQMDVASEQALQTGAPRAEQKVEAPLEMMIELDPLQTRMTTSDDTWLQVSGQEGVRFDKVQPVRAYPLTAPWEFLVLCDEEDLPVAVLPETRGLPDESFQALHQCLFWRYFIPRVREVLDVAQDSGPATKWHVMTDRGAREFLVKKRHDVRTILPRRLLIRDSEGNRYDLPDYGELAPPSQVALERLQFV